tara:strand:- start:1095 stop:1358 length:264 start_codon:yes stop_codon:yes gene_type:complete
MEGQKMNVDIDSTTEIVCDECEHNVFTPAFFLRKVSRFISPDGKDRLLPLDTMACNKCGNVNKEFQASAPQPKTEIKTNNLKDGKNN